MKKTLEDFIDALENDEFKKAHEIMEKKWKEYKKQNHPLTKLLKGFINGASAFELVRKNNFEGAKRLWNTYEKNLDYLTKEIEEYNLFIKANTKLQKLKEDRL